MLPLEKPLGDCRIRKELLLIIRITQRTCSVQKNAEFFVLKPGGTYSYHEGLNTKITGVFSRPSGNFSHNFHSLSFIPFSPIHSSHEYGLKFLAQK
jgi:hypothetical protein